jgi:hypothetical protein
MAFQTQLIDLSRVANSLRSQKSDIVAKASGKISGDQYWRMLQTLLEDRFNLRYHHETKEALVYALILASHGLGVSQRVRLCGKALRLIPKIYSLPMLELSTLVHSGAMSNQPVSICNTVLELGDYYANVLGCIGLTVI